MIDFRQTLQDKVIDLAKDWVGTGTHATNFVKTFDDHLYDQPLESLPFLVVNVRRSYKANEGEIGKEFDLYTWEVHIYYLDINEDYKAGDDKRDNILSRVHKNLEQNRRLDNLEQTDSAGNREYVYDHAITDVLFDSSGQEEYYSFVSELYLEVFTARN